MTDTSLFQSENHKCRILLLSDINSSHTWKWAISLAGKGLEIGVFSLHKLNSDWVSNNENIKILYAPQNEDSRPLLSKVGFLASLPELKSCIKEFKPDIVHAHYASSYGLLGALSGFHPFIISVWGSDVFDFPKSSLIYKQIFKFNLKRADKICSTSQVMKGEIQKYTNKDISVIPFGIDINVFKPFYAHHVFKENSIVIGTVKALEKKYGIDYLIDAFAILKKRLKEYPIKLLIVGKGNLETELKAKASEARLGGDVIFTGFVPPSEIPFYQNMLTISVFPSIADSESFGVSVIEAMACEKPVVVTDAGGLPEVVEDGITGLVVPRLNAGKLAEAIETLIKDEQLRNRLGKQGRQRVAKLYNWEDNLTAMINMYDEIKNKKAK